MIAILRLLCLRDARRRPLRVALGFSAVALGVALYVSVAVASGSVLAAMEASARELAGRAELAVTDAGALTTDVAVLERVEAVAGLDAAPVIRRNVELPAHGEPMVVLLGVDLLREGTLRLYRPAGAAAGSAPLPAPGAGGFLAAALLPGGALIGESLARERGIATGSELLLATAGGARSVRVVGTLADEGAVKLLAGRVLVTSLATAQHLFGLEGRCDRIEIAAAGREVADLGAELAGALGPAYAVSPAARRSPLVEEMLAHMRSMGAMSAMALAVAFFLVYNAVAISVTERARAIGALRSCGATRAALVGAHALEWGLVGLAGALAGVALGYGFARLFLGLATSNVNQFLVSLSVSDVHLPLEAASIGAALGTLTALAAALVAAGECARTPPVELLRPNALALAHGRGLWRAAVLGLVLIALALAAMWGWGGTFGKSTLLALAVAVFLSIGLVAPQALLWVARGLGALARRWDAPPAAWLGLDALVKHPERSALTVVAFAGAITLQITSASIVRSFEVGSARWMDEAFPFELSVSSHELGATIYGAGGFAPQALERVAAAPGVDGAYGVRCGFQPFRDTDILIVALDARLWREQHEERGPSRRVAALMESGASAAFEAGVGVLVSENLAQRMDLAVGDTIELAGAERPQRFRVAAAIEDYSWPTGTVFIDRAVYAAGWKDPGLTYVDARCEPGVDLDDVRASIAGALSDLQGVHVYDVAELKAYSKRALRQATALIDVQVFVALAIGFLGIVNTQLIAVLRRARELALLRAVGAARSLVVSAVAAEALLTAVLGALLGIGLGLGAARVFARPYMLEMSGFLMPFAVPWRTLVIALTASVVLGLLAAIVPARRAASLEVTDALRWE